MGTPCPCGSGRPFESCCAPILAGGPAPSPEALMRSRYAAFVTVDTGHLEATLAPESTGDFDRAETESWAKEAQWLGLEIRATTGGGPADETGTVEFVARYRARGQAFAHHELASFRKEGERWLYVDGLINPKPAQAVASKVGRNDPCPCGSGKKFKKCCGG